MALRAGGLGNLHDDKHSDENRDKARPSNPSDLLELPHTRTRAHHDRRDDGEVVCAERVVGQRVESCRYTDYTRCCDDDERNEEEDAGDFFDDAATD